MIVPVFCDNPKCRTIWFARNPIGGSFIGRGNKLSPCPECSGSGSLPDGEYTPGTVIFSNPSQWHQLRISLEEIQNSIIAGASVDEVNEQIQKHPEILEFLGGFVPRNLKDLQTLFIIIGMLYAALKVMSSDDTSDALHIPKNLVGAIENLVPNDVGTDAPTEDSIDHTGCEE